MSRKTTAWILIVLGIGVALLGFLESLGESLRLVGIIGGVVLGIVGFALLPNFASATGRRRDSSASGDGGGTYAGGDDVDNGGDGGDGDGGGDGGGGGGE